MSSAKIQINTVGDVSLAPCDTYKQKHDYDFVGNWDRRATFLLQPKQDVEEAVFPRRSLAGAGGAVVHQLVLPFLDDPSYDELHPLAAGEALAWRHRHHPRELGRREQVGDAEPRDLLLGDLERVQELVAVAAPAADGAHHHDVVGELADPLVEVHASVAARARVGGQLTHEPRHLALSDALERPHPGGGEQLLHADLAEVAPPLAVGREGDVAAAEGDLLDGGGEVAVGEPEVLVLQDLLRHRRRRHDHRGDLAHPQLHDGAVLLRQRAQRAVDLGALHHEVVEAADQRQRPWPRGKVEPWFHGR
ncbi:Os02g0570800 [Oryza sativa Japonica Group]|uniref:Os02g0570800 protein n=1 Tax=Oryza sativa subsp. japonica TaxID=39947 RepID=A0A0P0VKM8_ORYSJ|nr:Os02g0570800 [Oryza sativa Japonica Group]